MAIDGRPHEVDGVYDSRLDKDEDVYQEVSEKRATARTFLHSVVHSFQEKVVEEHHLEEKFTITCTRSILFFFSRSMCWTGFSEVRLCSPQHVY